VLQATRGRFLKGGINYTRYNSYSRDKSAIPGIKNSTRNKNGFPEALFILGIAIPGISLVPTLGINLPAKGIPT